MDTQLSEQNAAMQSAWKNLQLEGLEPLDIAPEHWVTMSRYKHGLVTEGLAEILPLPVARIRAANKSELMSLESEGDYRPFDSPYHRQKSIIAHDIGVMKVVLFHPEDVTTCNPYANFIKLEAKLYTGGKVEWLHWDKYRLGFVCRIGALPFDAIHGSVAANAPPETRILMDQGKARRGEKARQSLREMDILRPQDVDLVYLMAGRRMLGGGTFHCSGLVPKPTFSAFVRS